MARMTDLAAVMDQPMMGVGPIVFRNHPHRLSLGLRWCARTGQTESIRNPKDMRVDRDRRRLKCDGEDDVRRLASDTREREQFVHGFRNTSAVTLDEDPARLDD